MNEVSLRAFLRQVRDEVTLREEVTYKTVGVLSYGKGLFERPPVTGAQTSYKSYFRIRTDQFVYSKLFAWEGAVAVVPPSLDGRFVSQEFPTFDIDTQIALPHYVSLLCRWEPFWLRLRQGETGMGGRRKRVHPAHLETVRVPLPSVRHQRRLVDLVRTLDATTDAARRTMTALGITVDAYMGQHEEQVTGPAVGLGSLLASTIGGVWGGDPGTDDVDVRVVRATEFDNRGILKLGGVTRSITRDQLSSRMLRPSDILLEKSGGGPKQPVGRVVWVGQLTSATVCSNFVQLVRPDVDAVDPRYLFHRMWAWHRQGRTLEYQSNTTGIRNLRTKDYLSQLIVLPLRETQSDIVAVADALIDAEARAQRVVRALADLRSAVLHNYLAGDHEIPEAYDLLLEAS